MTIDNVVTLYKDNQRGQSYRMHLGLVGRRFWASKYGTDDAFADWPLERRVGAFLGDDEPDGLQSVVDGPDVQASIVEEVRSSRWRPS